MIHSARPAQLQARARELDSLAAAIGNNANAVRDALNRLLAAWQGAAAGQAAEVLTGVLRWSDHNATAASRIARGLYGYAEVVGHAQDRMRSLVDGRPADSPEAADQLRNTAAEVMRRYETDSEAIYRGLPHFTSAPSAALPGIAAEPPVPVVRYPARAPRHARPAITPVPLEIPGMDNSTTTSDFAPLSGDVLPPGSTGGDLPGPAPDGTTVGTSGLAGGGIVNAGSAGEAVMAGEEGAGVGLEPAGPPARRGTGQQDGEHRDRFHRAPDLVGELPAVCPPVLGR